MNSNVTGGDDGTESNDEHSTSTSTAEDSDEHTDSDKDTLTDNDDSSYCPSSETDET